MIKYLYKYA